MRQLGPTDLKRLHREWHRRTEGRLGLLLDSIQSPFNLGAIVRTAAAFRVDELYLSGTTRSPTDHKAGKTAMGTERYLSWTVWPSGPDAVAAARQDGYQVVGLELADHAVPLHQLQLETDPCIAVGHEDHGLAASTMAACDVVAFIPQLGRVGSLNVAAATAIAIYELRRKQWSA